MACCSIGCGADAPTSMSSAPRRAWSSSRGDDQMVVDDHVGPLQAGEPLHGDEARVPGTRADERNRGLFHDSRASGVIGGADPRQDVVCAAGQQPLRGLPSDGRGVRPRTFRGCACRPAAVGRNHHAGQRNPIAGDGRVRADRHLTAAAEGRHDRALGVQGVQRVAVADLLHQGGRRRVVLADLDGHDPLAGGRHADVGGHQGGNAPRLFQSPEPGGGQDDPVHVALIELAQPRVEIAAERDELRVRQERGELCHAADAARAHPRRRAESPHRLVEGERRRRAPAAPARRADLPAAAWRALRARRESAPACPCCCAPRDRSCRRGALLRFP